MRKSIFAILVLFVVSVSSSCAQNGFIQKLNTGFHGNQYTFTVFGDTRTSAAGSLDAHDVVFSLARNQVFQSIQDQLSSNKAMFSLFTGDLLWQGGRPEYWDEPETYFPKTIRKKIFPIPGNHETWLDPTLENYFSFFSHLEKNHSYYFTLGNSLFLSLCTGGYIGEYTKESSFKQDRKFTCIKADYSQLQLPLFLENIAADMVQAGTPIKNIFIQYHKPSFSYYKHPPLNKENDPVEALKAFSLKNDKVQIVVFNGHNHTTELYQPADNITVLVAGGGGAPQKLLSADLPSSAVKDIYAEKNVPEVFWPSLGKPTEERTQRINYWTVKVDNTDNQVTITEKVLTFNSLKPVFMDGLTITNGKIRKSNK